ncbi:MAG: hypothetical protein IJ302_00670 [Clostridia bacterium]|nr:hypothetical protein [Clostridia bacterium]
MILPDGRIIYTRRSENAHPDVRFCEALDDHKQDVYAPENARGGANLVIYDPATGERRDITKPEEGKWDFRPGKTGNSDEIVYVTARLADVPEIHICRLDGSDDRKIGSLLSCLVYTRMVKYLGIARTGLIGGIIICLLPFSIFGGTAWFLVVYGAAQIGYSIISMVIPNMMYRSIPQDIISIYNTWRGTLNSVGSVVSTMLFGFLMEMVPAYVLLLMGALGLFGCTLGHYFCYRERL